MRRIPILSLMVQDYALCDVKTALIPLIVRPFPYPILRTVWLYMQTPLMFSNRRKNSSSRELLLCPPPVLTLNKTHIFSDSNELYPAQKSSGEKAEFTPDNSRGEKRHGRRWKPYSWETENLGRHNILCQQDAYSLRTLI